MGLWRHLVQIPVVLMLMGQAAQAKDADIAPDALKILVAPHGWLNTTRPLYRDELRGRVFLLHFWDFNQVASLQMLPAMRQIERDFGKDVSVIGVYSPGGDTSDHVALRKAVLRYGIGYAVVNDANATIRRAFSVTSLPSFAVVGPEGTTEVFYGKEHLADVRDRLRQIVQEHRGRLWNSALPMRPEAEQEDYSLLSAPSMIAYMADYKDKRALLVADSGHDRIVISNTDGAVMEVIGAGKEGYMDGDFAEARFDNPQGVLVQNDLVYIADTGNHALRVADLKTRKVDTLLGAGIPGVALKDSSVSASSAQPASPWHMAFWPDDQHIAITVAGLNQVWGYDIAKRMVTLLAGSGERGLQDGAALQAKFMQPSGLAAAGDRLYISDGHGALRVLEKGMVRTLIGKTANEAGYKDGVRGVGLMHRPQGMAATKDGVYIADSYNHAIRRFKVASSTLETVAGMGTVSGFTDASLDKAQFSQPSALALMDDQMIFVADTNNQIIRVANLEKGTVSTVKMREESRREAPALADALPNTLGNEQPDDEPLKLMHDNLIRMVLQLKDGWHLQREAPSYLALYDLVDHNNVVVSFDRDMLVQQRLLIPARVGHSYKLQGVFYICPDTDKKDAQCLIQSLDIPVSFEEGAPNKYVIKLKH